MEWVEYTELRLTSLSWTEVEVRVMKEGMEGEQLPETDLTRCHDDISWRVFTLEICKICFPVCLRIGAHLLRALWRDRRFIYIVGGLKAGMNNNKELKH